MRSLIRAIRTSTAVGIFTGFVGALAYHGSYAALRFSQAGLIFCFSGLLIEILFPRRDIDV